MIFRAAQNCFNIPCMLVCWAPQTTAMRTVSLLFIPQSEAQIAHTAFWPGCTPVQSVRMLQKVLWSNLSDYFQISKNTLYKNEKWYLYFLMLLSGCITTQVLCVQWVYMCGEEWVSIRQWAVIPSVTHGLQTQPDLSPQAASFIAAVNIWNIKYKN